jgi:hypothetical protein
MIKVVRTSETLIHSNETTWRYIPEDSKLHIRRRENLKSHATDFVLITNIVSRQFRRTETRKLCIYEATLNT